MRLRDLVQRPELGLRVLVGDDGALDRPVMAVRVTDLPDPSRYLNGGELVLSGLVWHAGAESSQRFVGTLARAGVTALAAGEAALGGVPADLVEACERHGVPLLSVPTTVSFQAIVDAAVPAVWTERAAGLSTALTRHRTMVSAIGSGAHLADLLAPVAAQLGLQCWVLNGAGRLRAGTGKLSQDRCAAAMKAFYTKQKLPAAAGDLTIHRVGGSVAVPFAAWCLVTRGGPQSAVDELISLVELEQASLDERGRIERRLLADLVYAAASESDPAAVRAHLTACGLRPDQATTVIAARLDDGADDAQRNGLTLLEQLLCAPATAYGKTAVAVVSARDGLLDWVRAGLASVLPALRRSRFAIGVSSVAPTAAEIGGALQQAVTVLPLAAALPDRATLLANDEITSHRLLLAAVPAPTRQAFHDQLLGPLLAYDQRKRIGLVPTLRAFLAASGSWQECAEQLHIHVNTLRYRLRRIEQLTGRDLQRFDHRVDLYLALGIGP
jgi:hypothetical protein